MKPASLTPAALERQRSGLQLRCAIANLPQDATSDK